MKTSNWPPTPPPKRPGRKPANRRSRAWEQRHPPVTFVGIQPSIRQAIRDLAAHYRAHFGMAGGVDAVARELLRYALMGYRDGLLEMPTGSSRPRLRESPGLVRTSYRLPAELVAAIRAIPVLEQERAGPRVIQLTLGQVLNALFLFALESYNSGGLVLYTAPKMVIPGLAARRAG